MRIRPSFVPATAVVRRSNSFRVSDIRFSWYSFIRLKRWIIASSTVRLVSKETYMSAAFLMPRLPLAKEASDPSDPMFPSCPNNAEPMDEFCVGGSSTIFASYRTGSRKATAAASTAAPSTKRTMKRLCPTKRTRISSSETSVSVRDGSTFRSSIIGSGWISV